RNRGGQPLAIDEASVVSGPYRILGEVPGVVPVDDPATASVRENELALLVEFVPEATGRLDGSLVIHNGSSARPTLEVPLCGFGGGPILTCSTESLDIGPTAVGVPRTRSILCTNAGTDDPLAVGDNLVIESMAADLGIFSARIVND